MLEIAVLAVALAMVICGVVFQYRGRHWPVFDQIELKSTDRHTHRFDVMVGDGAGWRCGICGKPKAEGT